jgi:hypothetical protein
VLHLEVYTKPFVAPGRVYCKLQGPELHLDRSTVHHRSLRYTWTPRIIDVSFAL